MESHKALSFVLRSIPFKDFDKRVILLTKQFGKVVAIAPRAQKSQKRFGVGLESLTLVEALYQMKANSSLGQLQEVQILNPFSVLKKSVKKMAYGSYFLEIIGEVMGENESSPHLFDFLHSFLEALEKSSQEEVLARFFEARL
ncbi:MAG: DNA repair protein RecO, partial [Deltaproteobacteria bacterium]|nr:DNA repair protein RecO [Deltaproteobacteria bacterium]